MNRRSFLGLLALIPGLKHFVPKKPESYNFGLEWFESGGEMRVTGTYGPSSETTASMKYAYIPIVITGPQAELIKQGYIAKRYMEAELSAPRAVSQMTNFTSPFTPTARPHTYTE